MRPLTASTGLMLLSLLVPGHSCPPFPLTPSSLTATAVRAQVPNALQTDIAALELLHHMLQAASSLALSGDQITTISRNGLDLSSEQMVQIDGGRAMRLDYLRPQRLAGEQIIDNGHFYCHLVPSQDTLELSPSRIHAIRVHIPEILKQIRSGRLIVQGLGQDTIAGHVCGIVSISVKSGSIVPWRKFWIDLSNGAQLRIEQYDAAGKLQSASYFKQVNYNATFDNAAFRLPHSGSKVVMRGFAAPSLTLDQVRQQAGASWPTPTYLPNGFHFQAGSVSDMRGHRVVELRYVNSVNILSIFQTPDQKGGVPSHIEPTKMEHPRPGVLFGRQGGMKVVIVGNLGSGEMEKVLVSLH